MINCNQLATKLTERFGLPIDAVGRSMADGYMITISPLGVERTISFIIEVVVGWRSISATFLPANYASSLVAAMQNATKDQQSAFLIFTKSIIEKGGNININISGHSVNPIEINSWPERWETVEISLRKGAIIIEPDNKESSSHVIYPWVVRFFGMIMALLPLEEAPSSFSSIGEEEGAEFEIKTKQYERSKINRAACIEIHGLNCFVCGIDFENIYGDLGEGFIHVHHITPVSLMKSTYIIEPRTDLIPVCPNCHAMLHRESPPVSIAKLTRIIKSVT